AAVALWGNVLNRDLITTFRLHMLAVDDPLLDLLADSRLGRPRLSDGLWIRLVDVPRALAQRHYARPVDLVVEVADELCPQNEGRWRLTAPASSALWGFSGTCERTTAPADLVLPVRALGAAYLGGTRLGALAWRCVTASSRPPVPTARMLAPAHSTTSGWRTSAPGPSGLSSASAAASASWSAARRTHRPCAPWARLTTTG